MIIFSSFYAEINSFLAGTLFSCHRQGMGMASGLRREGDTLNVLTFFGPSLLLILPILLDLFTFIICLHLDCSFLNLYTLEFSTLQEAWMPGLFLRFFCDFYPPWACRNFFFFFFLVSSILIGSQAQWDISDFLCLNTLRYHICSYCFQLLVCLVLLYKATSF